MRAIHAPAKLAADEGCELDNVTFARAKAGESSARAALIERYQRPVFALLWRMVGTDRELVEDLAQETFVRVLAALPRFDTNARARPITWILTIATRLALDHLRENVSADAQRDHLLDVPGGIPVALPQPDQDADRRALAVALVQAVDALRAPFRAAFLLREVHGLAYVEIAAALSIDVGTVKSRLARAREALQASLAQVHDDAR